jgi:hypothetical protein
MAPLEQPTAMGALVTPYHALAPSMESARIAKPHRTMLLTVLTGAVLGVLVTISSAGAGALGIIDTTRGCQRRPSSGPIRHTPFP